MSLNPLIRLPISSSRTTREDSLVKHSFFSTRTTTQKKQRNFGQFVVEAKGKKGMAARQYGRAAPPPLPKIEDDGLPRFVVFIRMANVCSLFLFKKFIFSKKTMFFPSIF